MTPVAFQASGTLLGSTGADITPVIPAHQAGDILILQAVARSNAVTLTTPSGWTSMGGLLDVGTTWRSYWYTKVAASSSETNPLCDWSATTGDKYGHVSTVRNADPSFPFGRNAEEVAAGRLRGGATTDPGTISVGVGGFEFDNYVMVKGMSGDNVATAVAITATNPATFTPQAYTTIITGADCGQFVSDGIISGAPQFTGDVTFDFNGAPLVWSALILCIRYPITNPGGGWIGKGGWF